MLGWLMLCCCSVGSNYSIRHFPKDSSPSPVLNQVALGQNKYQKQCSTKKIALKKHLKVGSNYSIRHFPKDSSPSPVLSKVALEQKKYKKTKKIALKEHFKKLGAIIGWKISQRTPHLLNPTLVLNKVELNQKQGTKKKSKT